MTEQEYVMLSNRIRITNAKNQVADCIAGEDFGVSTGQRRALLDILHTIEDRLFKKIEGFLEHDDG